MIYAFFTAALLLLIISFIREKRRKFLLRLFLLFSVSLYLLLPHFISPDLKTLIIDADSPSYNADFKGIDKTDAVIEKYGGHYNIIIRNTAPPVNESGILFSDRGTYDIKIDEPDMGIDTAYTDNERTYVEIMNFSGGFTECSVSAIGENTLKVKADTSSIVLEGEYRKINLHCNDSNKYNDFFYIENTMNIGIIDTVYSRTLQTRAAGLSALFENFRFIPCIFRDGRLISSENNLFDGYILLADIVDFRTDKPQLRVRSSNMPADEIESFLSSALFERKRIENPFNSDIPQYNIPLKHKLSFYLFNKAPRVVLLIACSVLMIMLF